MDNNIIMIIINAFKACGQHMQEINCDEFMTPKNATWYVKGLAASGSWLLFDKVEKLNQSRI